MQQAVRLTIPASDDYLRLARLATADVAARVGFDFEAIEDLRIAVDELAFAVMACTDGPLTLEFRMNADALSIEGTAPERENGGAPALSELASSIVSAVIDTSELLAHGAIVGFTLEKRSPAQ